MLLAFGLLDVSAGLGLKFALPDLSWVRAVPSAVSSVPTLAGFWLEGWREESHLGRWNTPKEATGSWAYSL